MTLAIRGRGDDCNLEIRQDGTANAILTPNGDRGGIGCGAIAVAEVSPTIRSNPRNNSNPRTNCDKHVAHSLKAEGFDASEDGTGRGVPLVPEIVGALSDGAHMGGGRTVRTHTREESLPCVSSKWSKGSGGPAGDECQNLVPVTGGFFNDDKPIAFDTTQITSKANRSNPQPGDPCHTIAKASDAPAIAFPSRMSATQCATSENVSCAIGAANPTAVGFQNTGQGWWNDAPIAQTIRDGSAEGASHSNIVKEATMAVRRLTPRECERLQGFPDDFTLVQFNGKAVCDGPRYKAIGNSMAVPNIEWIGRRMDLVDELVPRKEKEL